MKKTYFLFIAIIFSNLCHANDDDKWFVGFGGGSAKYEGPIFKADDNLVMLSGGYVFSNIVSVEASYIDLGNVSDRVIPSNQISLTQDILTLEARGFTAASIFGWEIMESVTLSGKLGISILDIEKQWSGGTLIDADLANDIGGNEMKFFAGVQLKYQINESFSLGINWDRYEVENIDVDGIYASANIHF